MSSRVLSGLITAACLSGVAVLGAQTPASPASAAIGAQKADSPAVTVIGCVQKETVVLKAKPMAAAIGVGDEFVLTNTKLSTGMPSTDEPPAAAEPAASAPVGTSGSASNFGKVYRVTGDKENDLKAFVGQRVEISGAFKSVADAKAELSAVGTSGKASAEPTRENTPEITITSIKPSAGSCSGGGQ